MLRYIDIFLGGDAVASILARRKHLQADDTESDDDDDDEW